MFCCKHPVSLDQLSLLPSNSCGSTEEPGGALKGGTKLYTV